MESFLANLKQQVQCSLCKETLTDPKIAYCFHTFCKMCIKTNTQVDERDTNAFKCPQCDSQTLLQDLNDVEDLHDSPIHSRILQVLAFVENEKICSVSASHPEAQYQCIDCNHSLCEECLLCHSKIIKNHQVVLLSDLKKEDVEKMLKRESPCKIHDDQDVELHCQDCDMLICCFCLKEHHLNHKVLPLQEFIANKRDVMSKNLHKIVHLTKDESEKHQQEHFALLMLRDGEKAKQQIKEHCKKLMKELADNEQQLLTQVEKNVIKANSNLRLIRHSLQAQDFISNLVEEGTASDLVSNIDSSNAFIYDPYPQVTTGVVFDHNEDLCKQVTNGLGRVRAFKQADEKYSSIKTDSSDIKVFKKSKLVINLKTSEGEVTDENLENVRIQFTPDDYVKVGGKHMTDDGEITVDFIPCVAGELTVDVQVHGNDISNSPLVMAVKPQEIKEVTGQSKLKDALNTGSYHFSGIAVNKANSKIAIADWNEHCIRVFSMEGDLLLTYGSKGSELDQLNGPHCLAFLDNTDLVISDRYNHRLCIVNTATGKLVKTFGCQGNGNGQFGQPCGVHVDDDGNIIVCDFDNKRVQVFTKDGDYLYQFSEGSPFTILKHSGLFYVGEMDNSLVRVLEMKDNHTPTTVTIIDGKDYTDVKLQKPYGLAIDNNNHLLICDYSDNLIHKYTLDGHYVGQSRKLTHKLCYIAVFNDGLVICTTEGGGVIFLNNNN